MESENDICYPLCKAGFTGSGPICWTGCPLSEHFDCGAICTTSKDICDKMVMEDGRSNNVLDIIYESEMKEYGECDVMDVISQLAKYSKDFKFGVCEGVVAAKLKLLA